MERFAKIFLKKVNFFKQKNAKILQKNRVWKREYPRKEGVSSFREDIDIIRGVIYCE